MKAPIIFLIGSRGSGKTTVAQLLAQRLGWSWCDADFVLEKRLGRTIREVFATEGEEAFRIQEMEILAELSQARNTVIATGGGIVLKPGNRERLRTGFVIWLTASPEILYARMLSDITTLDRRPPLAQGGLDEVRDVLRQREPCYQECADLTIDTADLEPGAVAERIWGELPFRPE